MYSFTLFGIPVAVLLHKNDQNFPFSVVTYILHITDIYGSYNRSPFPTSRGWLHGSTCEFFS